MSDLRTAAQQALEALERARPLKADYTTLEYLEEAKRKHYAAMAALRAAMAQQAEPVEPVAWRSENANPPGGYVIFQQYPQALADLGKQIQPLYAAPPQRKPLPKHDQHCVDVPGYGLMAVRLVRAVERAHGITDPQVADRLARHGIPMPEGDPK